jgi:hypothetical protein
MTDWFDILMRVLTIIALFAAGYRIGWSMGFEKCRSLINDFAAQFVKGNKELNDLRKKVEEYEKNEEKG